MEKTRIRYTKQENGIMVSKEMLAKEAMVIALIDPVTMSFKIKTKDGTVLGQGAATKMAYVQKMIKKELKELGVKFFDEVRNVLEEVETKTEGDKNESES